MAGLWDASTAADGSGIEPCAVITIDTNAVMNVDGRKFGFLDAGKFLLSVMAFIYMYINIVNKNAS